MKKNVYISVFAIIIALVVVYSCNKGWTDIKNDQNQIVFEDLSLKTNISPNFYDNHIYLIEKIGENKEKENLISTIRENSVNIRLSDITEVKKHHFNNSDVLMYSVSIKNSENKIIVYQYNDVYIVNLMEYYAIDGGKTQFVLKTSDNQLFYSVQLDSENKIGNLTIKKNPMISDFSNKIYNMHVEKHNAIRANTTALDDEDCCRHADGWSACMDCTAAACGKSWLCVAALVAVGTETLAGFAVSCIGAGPNTFC
jgi:hypothetical protein